MSRAPSSIEPIAQGLSRTAERGVSFLRPGGPWRPVRRCGALAPRDPRRVRDRSIRLALGWGVRCTHPLAGRWRRAGGNVELRELGALHRSGRERGHDEVADPPAVHRRDTGIEVNYVDAAIIGNNEFFAQIQPDLEAGNPTGWDIMVMTDWMIGNMIRLGYLEHFDVAAHVPNFVANAADKYNTSSTTRTTCTACRGSRESPASASTRRSSTRRSLPYRSSSTPHSSRSTTARSACSQRCGTRCRWPCSTTA